jgi:hypothetical protein
MIKWNSPVEAVINKWWRTPKRESRMDNVETSAKIKKHST